MAQGGRAVVSVHQNGMMSRNWLSTSRFSVHVSRGQRGDRQIAAALDPGDNFVEIQRKLSFVCVCVCVCVCVRVRVCALVLAQV